LSVPCNTLHEAEDNITCACVFVYVCVHRFLGMNISNMVTDRGSVTKDNQQEMADGESTGHVIDNVT